MLSHRNLLHNIRSMGRAIQIQEEDRFVSWLPLYHDMGLIGAVFGSLYHGIPLILMSPLSFIAKPRRWLNAIDRYRGTISAAPNFAYELCANSIPDEVIKKINLSSWRLAFNGAEPISPGTLNKFIEKFSKSGFQKTSFYPVYGLAENSVGLSFPPPGRGPLLDSVNREIFTNEGRAVPSKNSDNDLVFVCCGSPIPENKIRIVKENDEEAPERILGSIQFQSPSSTAGYYKNADATKTLFSGEWLNTGDTGYMADGELYITGRQKEIIIRGGRNIYPYELEDAIGEIPGIRPGGVAVFSLQSGGIEKMIVVAESREQKTSEKESLKQKITDLCINLHQFAPDDIVIAPIRTVLRTSSGKIRRGSIKKLYETGSIGKTPSVKMQMIRLELYSLPGRAARILKKTASLAYGLYFWTTAAFLLPAAFLSVLLVPGVKHRFVALRMIFKVFLVTVNLSVKTQGKENLESDSSVIYVSNHTSYLDAMLIISAMPFPVKFIAKAEFKKHIFSKFILSRLNVLFVERFDARGGIEDARTLTGEVRHSHPLFFFAEGTFTKQAGLRNFRMGAFAAAVQNQAGIIPVSIQGARNALRDESFLPEHSKIKISFGEIIRTDREGWDAAIELRDRTRKIILKHCGETDLRTLN
ncbi:MAG: AMP-binding protein [Spirochaetia bacterium]|nr:AMP-binding protein [Spirochaetia bacterium]